MGLISRLFSKSTDDFFKKGDSLFSGQRYFEARSLYEDGLKFYLAKGNGSEFDSTSDLFRTKIAQSNGELARVNIGEAEHAISCGAVSKAIDHLELALSLTVDDELRNTCHKLLATLDDPAAELPPPSLLSAQGGCGSCSATQPDRQSVSDFEEPEMSHLDHYELLIRQLPAEMFARYAGLGDEFIDFYLVASRDDHENALNLLEEWYKGTDEDIYWYEKGMMLHRLGNVEESETCFRNGVRCNSVNPLPRIGLALLLCEGHRLDEAANQLDAMIAEGMIVEQALMLRGDVSILAGDAEGAIERYGMLLTTPHARPAAEKIHELLIHSGRIQEAAVVKKKYLGGCRH
ncbi:MAG: hypothetical protein HXX11_02980 [Desulfuromonadales bacterium]|nr:hypothetical protein [Desulfuromonadales bacterium]